MVAAERGVENRSSTDSDFSAPAPAPSSPCSWPSTASTLSEAGVDVPESDRTREGPAPASSALRALALSARTRARSMSFSTRCSECERRPWRTATSGRYASLATILSPSSSAWRKTGTMIRAVFVRPSGFGRSARPMFCTIST